jgi:hypothetical protein
MFLIIFVQHAKKRLAINFPDFAMARFVLSTFSENVALAVPHLPLDQLQQHCQHA